MGLAKMTRYFLQVIQQLQLVKAKASKSGFTLVELLIATIMASIMITVLLGVVIDILNTNQRETSRTETQQEMQRALDYISSDLRGAVFIYDGECFTGTNPNCQGVFGANRIQIPNDTVPVLAFWKLNPLPDRCLNPANRPEHCNTDAVAGRTYSFVAYFLSKEDSNTWKGKARITRFEFNKFNSDGTAVNGNYTPPQDTGFLNWTPNGSVNPRASANGQSYSVLVDFVDDTFGTNNETVSCPDDINYVLTPTNATLTTAGLQNVRSFYACVRIPSPDPNNPNRRLDEFNQDVLISIRGNAVGKPGVREGSEQFLPVLQTQVLRRGVFQKRPQ